MDWMELKKSLFFALFNLNMVIHYNLMIKNFKDLVQLHGAKLYPMFPNTIFFKHLSSHQTNQRALYLNFQGNTCMKSSMNYHLISGSKSFTTEFTPIGSSICVDPFMLSKQTHRITNKIIK